MFHFYIPLLPSTLGSFVVVGFQSLSAVQLFTNTWTVASPAPLPSTVSWSLRKSMFFELVILSNHLIIGCALVLLSVFPSFRVFSYKLALGIRRPKYWSFSVSPSAEYSGLIFFRIDWFDLLAVQGTSQESSPALQLENVHSLAVTAFFMVQLSHPHMTTGKAVAFLYGSLLAKSCLCFLIHCVCHSISSKGKVT